MKLCARARCREARRAAAGLSFAALRIRPASLRPNAATAVMTVSGEREAAPRINRSEITQVLETGGIVPIPPARTTAFQRMRGYENRLG
jgi:hypothetical protein